MSELPNYKRLPDGDFIIKHDGKYHLSAGQVVLWQMDDGIGREYASERAIYSASEECVLKGSVQAIIGLLLGDRKAKEREAAKQKARRLFETWFFVERLKHGPCPKELAKFLEGQQWSYFISWNIVERAIEKHSHKTRRVRLTEQLAAWRACRSQKRRRNTK